MPRGKKRPGRRAPSPPPRVPALVVRGGLATTLAGLLTACPAPHSHGQPPQVYDPPPQPQPPEAYDEGDPVVMPDAGVPVEAPQVYRDPPPQPPEEYAPQPPPQPPQVYRDPPPQPPPPPPQPPQPPDAYRKAPQPPQVRKVPPQVYRPDENEAPQIAPRDDDD